MNIKDKHDFILYNKDEGKWYNKKLQVINQGMGFRELCPDEQSYAAAQAKAFKAEQENRKTLMIESIFIHLYMKVQLKYLNH